MARFFLSVHVGPDDRPGQMTDDEMRRGYERIASLEEDMRSAGALVMSGRLEGPDSSLVVSASNGKVLTTDGPFLESKEVIGGFYVIEAPDRAAAVEWASRTSAAISQPIEVRPFFAMAD
jgi:hypothetical protein